MAHEGEATVDQCHRGFSTATEASGYASPNPLFMRYTPDEGGRFAGQLAYGFLSVECFVRAAAAGNLMAAKNLGVLHEQGRDGVPQNHIKSMEWCVCLSVCVGMKTCR